MFPVRLAFPAGILAGLWDSQELMEYSLSPGVCPVHAPVRLQGDPEDPGALPARADPAHPGGAAPAHGAAGAGGCPRGWHVPKVTAECWDSSCSFIPTWGRDGNEQSRQELHQMQGVVTSLSEVSWCRDAKSWLLQGKGGAKSLEFLKRVGSVLAPLLPAVLGRPWCARVLH